MSDLRTLSLRPIPILTYHQIATTPPKGTPYRSLVVAPEDFARQMQMLKVLGYQGLSMGALMPYLQGEKVGRVVGITFDDGYLNNLQNALPILRKYGFSSTCYVVSGLLGQTNIWDRGKGIPQVPLMTASELRLWLQGGQEVGAHTRHHVHLPSLEADVCDDEIRGCKMDLETLLEQQVAHFCYPYGEFDARHVSATRDAAYLTATTTQRGRYAPEGNLFRVPRITVVRRTTRLGLWLRIAFGFRGNR